MQELQNVCSHGSMCGACSSSYFSKHILQHIWMPDPEAEDAIYTAVRVEVD